VTGPPDTQAPATEAPATEAPATEAPATEAPATEAPATEASDASPIADGSGEGGEAAPGAGERPDRRWRARLARSARALLALSVYTALALWLCAAAWESPAARLLGTGADPGLFAWFLGWSGSAVAHGRDPLFSSYVNVPDGINLMWNTSMLLPGAVLTPITRAWGPVVSYNLLMTASLALSAWTGYLAARRFVRSELAAAAGGLVYGFSPAMLDHARGHLHMTMLVLPPLILLLVDHVLVRQERPAPLVGAVLGAVAACQLLVGEEVLAFTAIVCVVLLVVLIVLYPSRVLSKAVYAVVALGSAAVVAGALIAYPLWMQLAGPQRIVGDIQADTTHGNDLVGFVTPGAMQWLRPDLAGSFPGWADSVPGPEVEQNAYIGVPMILIALGSATLLARRRRVALVAAVLAIFLAACSLGETLRTGGTDTGTAMPWATVVKLPLLASAVPNRLMLLCWLFLGLLLAIFVDWALSKRLPGRLVAVLGVGAVIATLLPSGPIETTPAGVPPFFTSTAVERIPEDSTVLIAPIPGTNHSEAMLWQAEAGMRFRIAGSYAVRPRSETDPSPVFSHSSTINSLVGVVSAGRRQPTIDKPSLRLRLVEDLRRWEVRTVVLGPLGDREPNRQAVAELLTALLGRPPEQVGGVQVWWDVRPEAL
jgi:hypothetical protein